MQISLPVSFWTLLVSNLSYSDAFTPPNLQNIFRTPRSPSGTIHDDTNQHDYINNDNHDAASDSRGLGKRTQFLQRLWAKSDDSPEIISKDSNNSNDNNAEEHQIRVAYLHWCEKYKKQTDSSRYPQFVNNYKVMGSIAKRGGKAMHLNEFADFTGEEYQILMKKKSKGATQPLTAEAAKQVMKSVPEKAQIQRNEAIGREESLTITTTLVEAKSMSSERQQQKRARNTEPQPQSQSHNIQDSIPTTTKDYSVNSAISDPSKTTKLIENLVGKDESRSMLSPTTETSLSKDKPKLMNKDVVKANKVERNLKIDDKKMKVDMDNDASSASTKEKVKKQEQTKHHQQINLTTVKPTDTSSSSSSSSHKPIASGNSNKDRSVKENIIKTTATSTIVSSSSSTAASSSSSPPNPKLPMEDSHESKVVATSRSDSSSSATTSQSLTNRKEKRNSDDLSSSKRKVLSSFDMMKEKYTKSFSAMTIGEVGGKKNNTDGGPAKANKEEQRQIEVDAKAKANALADAKADEEEQTRILAGKQRHVEEEKKHRKTEAKAKADVLAEEKADEEQQTRIQAEKQRQIEEREKQIEVEAKAKSDALATEKEQERVQAEKQRQVEEKRKMEAEAKTKADALAKTKAAEEEKTRIQAEEQRQVEEKTRMEAEAKAKADVLAKTKAAEEEQRKIQAEKERQAEEKKKMEVEAKTKADALAKSKAADEEHRKIQAEKQRQVEEKRVRIQAEKTAKALALAKAAEEEQKRIKAEKERHAEEERERIQTEARAKVEEEHRRQIEAEKKAKLEEDKRRLQIEAEEKAKMENEVEQQRIQANTRAKVEKERRQQIEAEEKVKLEKEKRKRQIEIENKAKAEEDQKRIQVKARAMAEERRRRLEDEKKAKFEEQQQIKAKAKAEAERRRRVEAEEEEKQKRIYAKTRAKVEEERKQKIEEKNAKLEKEKHRRQIVEAKKKNKAEKERKQIQAEARAKVEEERKQKKNKREEEELIKAEIKEKAKEERMRRLEAESKAKTEKEEQQERIHAEARAKVEEECRRRIQAEEKAKLKEEKCRLQIAEAEEKEKLGKEKLEKEKLRQQIVEAEKKAEREEEAEARTRVEEERRRQINTKAEEKTKIEEQSRRQIEIDKKAEENRIQVEARAKVEEERVRRKLLGVRLKKQKEALKKVEIKTKMKIEEERSRVEAAAKKKIEEERRGVEAEAKKKIKLAIAQEILAKKLVDEEDSKAKAEEAVAAAAAAAAVVEAKEKEEGGELRIRSAYLDWCLEFSKKPDKVRIEQFKKNYLLLEGVAKEEGKDIKLNEYADFTAAEFEKEIQAKQEVKEKEKQERLRKEQEEVETAFAAAGGDVGVINNKVTEGPSSDEIKVKDELFQVQDEDGNDIDVEKEKDVVLHKTKGKTVDTEDEWWKKEEGLDESMLQTDDSSSIWSGAKGRGDRNQSTIMSKSPHTASSSSENNDHETTTNADDPEVRKRVRAAYSNWCRTYKKEPDEGRFPKFKSNYIIMEKLANEQGREVTLNEFADCTPGEYERASRGKSAGRNDTGTQRLRKLRIEQEVKTSKVETRRVLHTTRNININQEVAVDEEHDEAAANTEVEKIALAKADEAAKRVEKIRQDKMKHGKENDESEMRVKVEREKTKQKEAATVEVQRIANAKAKAKKAEEERLRREWQEGITKQERIGKQEQNESDKVLELEAKKNYFEDRQRNGRKAAFSRTKTSKDDNDDTGTSRSNVSPDEETQPVVKPPPSKPKKSFQPRPTFASSLKNSIRSNINKESGFGGYRSSWRDQDGQESVDDDTNGIPITSDSKYISPNDDYMAPPPDIEETTREAFNDRSFFPNVDQTSSSNASPSVQKPASNSQSNSYDDSYFMDVPPTNDEELLDSSLSLNEDIYSESWSSPHDPPKQPGPTLLDPALEYINNGDTWYSNSNGGGGGGDSRSEIPPSASKEPPVESYSRRGPLLNKGASYLGNLSKGDASPSTDGINRENSYSNDNLSGKQYSQQQGSSQSAFPERIQAAYRDWCQYYGNVYSEDRLRTFSANFLAVEKYHRETGVSLILNELADMTSEEFQKRKM